MALCDVETEINDPELIELSVLLDRLFGFDSGNGDLASWIPVSKEDLKHTKKDEEVVTTFESDKFTVISSPNFYWNGLIYRKQ